ncbi:hypothetical protein PENSPDRAFT_654622 [Peniophora sp. CONT]|nr:hypothetical protein PENSPDRAFT_654622 [Peniophora sp. CONT]
MTIDDTSSALVNAHLAAGQNKVCSGNADLTASIEGKALFQESEEAVERAGIGYVGGGDGSTVLDHEIVFGDLNYHIDCAPRRHCRCRRELRPSKLPSTRPALQRDAFQPWFTTSRFPRRRYHIRADIQIRPSFHHLRYVLKASHISMLRSCAVNA